MQKLGTKRPKRPRLAASFQSHVAVLRGRCDVALDQGRLFCGQPAIVALVDLVILGRVIRMCAAHFAQAAMMGFGVVDEEKTEGGNRMASEVKAGYESLAQCCEVCGRGDGADTAFAPCCAAALCAACRPAPGEPCPACEVVTTPPDATTPR